MGFPPALQPCLRKMFQRIANKKTKIKTNTLCNLLLVSKSLAGTVGCDPLGCQTFYFAIEKSDSRQSFISSYVDPSLFAPAKSTFNVLSEELLEQIIQKLQRHLQLNAAAVWSSEKSCPTPLEENWTMRLRRLASRIVEAKWPGTNAATLASSCNSSFHWYFAQH